MSYLKAVILEGLRRYPPGHFVAPHAVTQDVVLDKYLIPKNASINFRVAEMGLDPKIWEGPMAFKPNRILNIRSQELEITGSREWKAVDGDDVDLAEKLEHSVVPMKNPLQLCPSGCEGSLIALVASATALSFIVSGWIP
ncbi:unnamed protein product [Dovyalis caffra]|uniref:Cytochrome P450 n=1 Tax=Dovyalis caffra TaxID=77055 RepID=A0AAV1RCZ1_9ROSI|nr:unnamed protein product [Dovyalis caffra]